MSGVIRTPEFVARVVEMRRSGMSNRAVADVLGVSETTIERATQRGVPAPKARKTRKLNPADVLHRYSVRIQPPATIAQAMGVTTAEVRAVLEAAGIEMRQGGRPKTTDAPDSRRCSSTECTSGDETTTEAPICPACMARLWGRNPRAGAELDHMASSRIEP